MFIERLPASEIAGRLGISKAAAEKQMTRLRHKLVEKLGPHAN